MTVGKGRYTAWENANGQRLSREQLLALMSENLNLPADRILESYSMTEINAFMLRCDYGRFHIPPFIEPVIFDEELSCVEGRDVRGMFGFLDPLALAYPGFIISGDEVRLVQGECPCGLNGPAVTEIGRARAREVKGCLAVWSLDTSTRGCCPSADGLIFRAHWEWPFWCSFA